jgi:hypothetical protein
MKTVNKIVLVAIAACCLTVVAPARAEYHRYEGRHYYSEGHYWHGRYYGPGYYGPSFFVGAPFYWGGFGVYAPPPPPLFLPLPFGPHHFLFWRW